MSAHNVAHRTFTSLVTLFLLSQISILTATPLPEPQSPGQNQGTPPGDPDPYSVTINDSPTRPNGTAPVPIPATATIYDGVAGGKKCRGNIMHVITLPSPASSQTTELCYDISKAAGCGVFMANKDDGCEARLFSESNCRMFNNVVVFVPEEHVTGGNWRSLSVRCGIAPPREEELGTVPFAGMITKQSGQAAKLDGGGTGSQGAMG